MAHTTSRGILTGSGGMLGLYCKQTKREKGCPKHIIEQEISPALKKSRKCKKDLVALMNASCVGDINIIFIAQDFNVPLCQSTRWRISGQTSDQ